MNPTSRPSSINSGQSPSGVADGPACLGHSTCTTVCRLACISTSRADAGIYRPLIRALAGDDRWHLSCLAGGTHSSADFGHTLDDLRSLKRVHVLPVLHFNEGDEDTDIAETCGRATIEFSKALAQVRPDLVFVLGDRPEMLAAALAALISRIPMAHLHGGEKTAGAYDDACRHAITKLAHLHFASHPQYADRIRATGEAPWRIHTVGALALDGLRDFQPLSVEELSTEVGLDFSKPTDVMAFYPETLSEQSPQSQIAQLLDALRKTETHLLILGTNADVGHAAFTEAVRRFADQRPGVRRIASLPQHHFWSCLVHARRLIGNSSAGLIEAASFGLPVVNIGERQAGRIRPSNVIDTACNAEAILTALARAESTPFRDRLRKCTNPYGDGHSAERIVEVLGTLPDRQTLLRK